ncbi:MAG TPA: hypothetical protein VH637_07910 [Streptosporangiaceae bacterium]|jgi:ribosome-associated translation inhibitor RaiA
MSETGNGSAHVLAEQLRLGAGFGQADQSHVLEILSSLGRHLAHWRADRVDLEISVKDRDGAEQKVTLEAWLPGRPSLVATSAGRDLDHALVEVRKEMIRQVEEEKARLGAHKTRPAHRAG